MAVGNELPSSKMLFLAIPLHGFVYSTVQESGNRFVVFFGVVINDRFFLRSDTKADFNKFGSPLIVCSFPGFRYCHTVTSFISLVKIQANLCKSYVCARTYLDTLSIETRARTYYTVTITEQRQWQSVTSTLPPAQVITPPTQRLKPHRQDQYTLFALAWQDRTAIKTSGGASTRTSCPSDGGSV